MPFKCPSCDMTDNVRTKKIGGKYMRHCHVCGIDYLEDQIYWIEPPVVPKPEEPPAPEPVVPKFADTEVGKLFGESKATWTFSKFCISGLVPMYAPRCECYRCRKERGEQPDDALAERVSKEASQKFNESLKKLLLPDVVPKPEERDAHPDFRIIVCQNGKFPIPYDMDDIKGDIIHEKIKDFLKDERNPAIKVEPASPRYKVGQEVIYKTMDSLGAMKVREINFKDGKREYSVEDNVKNGYIVREDDLKPNGTMDMYNTASNSPLAPFLGTSTVTVTNMGTMNHAPGPEPVVPVRKGKEWEIQDEREQIKNRFQWIPELNPCDHCKERATHTDREFPCSKCEENANAR